MIMIHLRETLGIPGAQGGREVRKNHNIQQQQPHLSHNEMSDDDDFSYSRVHFYL